MINESANTAVNWINNINGDYYYYDYYNPLQYIYNTNLSNTYTTTYASNTAVDEVVHGWKRYDENNMVDFWKHYKKAKEFLSEYEKKRDKKIDCEKIIEFLET